MSAFISHIVEGYLAPRRSVRRLLDDGHGMGVALLMVLLGYLITAIFAVIFLGDVPGRESGTVGFYVRELVLGFGLFFILSGLIFSVGKMAGGTGSRIETNVAVAWFFLVTSFLTPLRAGVSMTLQTVETENGPVEMPSMEPGSVLILLALSGVILWLLACYTAELHGFKKVWNVVGSLLMGMVAVTILFMFLAAALMGG